MGNHSVGRAFAATFLALEHQISHLSAQEILNILDTMGNQFRGADAEFDGCERPPHPLGLSMIKCFYPELPPMPSLGASAEQWDLWDDEWRKNVYQPFLDRYNFC